MKIAMKCLACNLVNFFMEENDGEERKCRACGGKLKAYTVDMKEEDGEESVAASVTPPEPIFLEILRTVIKKNSASMSMIQRCCSVGYNCAGRAMDWMEANGYVSVFEGAKARTVLITKEEFEKLYGAFETEPERALEEPSPAKLAEETAVEDVKPLEVSEELMPLYVRALREAVKAGMASVSFIQRRCSYGYNFSWKIIEWMEASGYITPFEGGKFRNVLLSKEGFEEKYGRLDEEN